LRGSERSFLEEIVLSDQYKRNECCPIVVASDQKELGRLIGQKEIAKPVPDKMEESFKPSRRHMKS